MKINEITDAQKSFFSNMGFKIVEEFNIGEYDLVLLHHSMYMQLLGTGYTVGLQRKGRDFTSPEDQHIKRSIDSLDLHDLKLSLNAVINWISKYGVISVGSFNERKGVFYEKVFKRAGINVEWKSAMGQRAMLLTL